MVWYRMACCTRILSRYRLQRFCRFRNCSLHWWHCRLNGSCLYWPTYWKIQCKLNISYKFWKKKLKKFWKKRYRETELINTISRATPFPLPPWAVSSFSSASLLLTVAPNWPLWVTQETVPQSPLHFKIPFLGEQVAHLPHLGPTILTPSLKVLFQC